MMTEDAQSTRPEGLPPAGWQPDPSGLHESRYWSGTGWTKHVRDGETQSVDIGARGMTLEDELKSQPESHKGLKMTFAIVGGVALLLVLLACAVLVPLAIQQPKLEREAQTYADEAVEAIATDWDQGELEARVSSEFWDATSRVDLTKMFAVFEKLGPMESFEPCMGGVSITKVAGLGDQIIGQYATEAECENGPATIQLVLIKHDDEWQVGGFRVESMALLDE